MNKLITIIRNWLIVPGAIFIYPVAFVVGVWIFSVPWLVQGADNDDDKKTWAKWQEIGALTNCDDDAINAAVICGGTTGVRVEGYNTLVFEIFYDHVAGNGYEFYLETCYEGQATTDCTDAADWHRISSEHTSPGLVQLDQAKFFVGGATAPISADHSQTWSIGGGYKRIRLAGFVATGTPGATDKIKVNLRALYLQAH